jgi:hypothetical protein
MHVPRQSRLAKEPSAIPEDGGWIEKHGNTPKRLHPEGFFNVR